MPAGYTELFMEQGASFNTTMTLSDVNGAAYNLVGYTASSQMKKSYYSANATGTFSVTTGASPVNGEITISMDAAATANITPGRYLFDVAINNGTIRSRVLEGMVIVSPQVTKI